MGNALWNLRIKMYPRSRKMKKMSRVLLIAAFLFMLQSVSSTSGLEENTGSEPDCSTPREIRRIGHHRVGVLLKALYQCKDIGEVCSLDEECCSQECCIDLCEHFCC